MTAVADEHIPLTRHRLAQRLRAAVLGPRGGGTTRRRASDAFRLGLAIVVVAVSIPVMRANSAAELAIVRALNPPPAQHRRAQPLRQPVACQRDVLAGHSGHALLLQSGPGPRSCPPPGTRAVNAPAATGRAVS